jgi:hypothetical protein
MTLKWPGEKPTFIVYVEQYLFSLQVFVVLHGIENRDGCTFIETQQECLLLASNLLYSYLYMSLARLTVGSYLVCLQEDSDVTSWVRDGLL